MKHNFIIKGLLSFLLLLLMVSITHAANRYWVCGVAGRPLNTNWSNTGNWSTTSGGAGGASVPGSADIAIFDNASSLGCNIDAVVNVGGISVLSTYSGNIAQNTFSITVGSSNAAFSGGTFTGGSAAITVNGTLTISGTAFTSTSGILTINNNFTYSSGSYTHNSGTVKINASGTITGNMTFHNMEFTGGAGTAAMTVTVASGTTLTVNNDLTWSGVYGIILNSGTIEAKGNIYLSNSTGAGGGSTIIKINGTGDQVLKGYPSGGPTLANSRMPSVEINKASGTLYLQGYITIYGNWNYVTGALDAGSSTLIFLLTKTISGTHTLNKVYFFGSPSISINYTYTITAGDTITVNDSLRTTNTRALLLNSGVIDAKGHIVLNNTSSSSGGTATLNICGSSNQTLTGSGIAGTGRLCHVNVNKTLGTLTLNSIVSFAGNVTYTQGTVDASTNASTAAMCGNLTLDARGATSDMHFYNLTIHSGTTTLGARVYADGEFTINSGATFSSSAYNTLLRKNWLNKGTYVPGNGYVVFHGDSPLQTISKPGATETFKNLQVYKLPGNVQLNSPATLTGTLSLVQGNLISSSSNLLTLNDNAVISGGSDISYVSGPMKKVGDEAFTFPLGGTSGGANYYHPLSITAPGVTTDVFTAEYIPSGYSWLSKADTVSEVDTCEHWTLQRVAGTSSVNITLQWNTNSCFNTTNYDDLTMVSWDGSKWIDQGILSLVVHDNGTGTLSSLVFVNFLTNPIKLTTGRKDGTPFYIPLSKHVNGTYYRTFKKKLYLKYEEKYRDGTLKYSIYDSQHNIVNTSSITINKNYGLNWLTIDLTSATGMVLFDYYIVEVENEKGQKEYARFRFH